MNKEKKLLHLLNERSEQAIPELNRTYAKLCANIAGNILDSAQDVEETVSDAILAAWNTIPPAQPESLSAYLGRITRNLAISRLRSNTAALRDQRLLVSLDELEGCLPAQDTVESALDSRLITQTINSYLATLPKINRIIFVRRYFCQETSQQIAALTGLTDRAVRSRLLRMRAQLRERLEKEGIFV